MTDTQKSGYRLAGDYKQIVNITHPGNNDIVEDEMIVEGLYSSDISEDIWVIIWPERACGRGWLQFEDVESSIHSIKENGKWSVYCYFGGPPQGYDLGVYTASDIVSDSLKNLYQKVHNKNFIALNYTQIYNGVSISDIPEGLVERSRIHVMKSIRTMIPRGFDIIVN